MTFPQDAALQLCVPTVIASSIEGPVAAFYMSPNSRYMGKVSEACPRVVALLPGLHPTRRDRDASL